MTENNKHTDELKQSNHEKVKQMSLKKCDRQRN